ncbi:ubiquitin-specific protease doa4 [Coemansia spiralis]|nr:ubiquitin-specific protease doa4 [Coemansia spiralis]
MPPPRNGRASHLIRRFERMTAIETQAIPATPTSPRPVARRVPDESGHQRIARYSNDAVASPHSAALEDAQALLSATLAHTKPPLAPQMRPRKCSLPGLDAGVPMPGMARLLHTQRAHSGPTSPPAAASNSLPEEQLPVWPQTADSQRVEPRASHGPPVEPPEGAARMPPALGRASTASGSSSAASSRPPSLGVRAATDHRRSSGDLAIAGSDGVLQGVRILNQKRDSNRAAVVVSPDLPIIDESRPGSPFDLAADPMLVSTAAAPAQTRRVPPPVPAALLLPRPSPPASLPPTPPRIALPPTLPLPSRPAAGTGAAEGVTSPRFYSQGAATGSDPSLSNPRNSGAFELHPASAAAEDDGAGPVSPGGQSRRVSQLLDAGTYGVTGLGNFGNTCFMNSVVQCLAGTEALVRFILCGEWKQRPLVGAGEPQATVTAEFAQLVELLWRGQYASVSPVGFRAAVAACSVQFGGSNQEDAHEFASFLLDALHESLNSVHPRPPPEPEMTPAEELAFEALPDAKQALTGWRRSRRRNWSVISRIFQGQIQSRLTCMACNHTSTTYHTFTELSVPIPPPPPAPTAAPRAATDDSSSSSSHGFSLLRRSKPPPPPPVPAPPPPSAPSNLPINIYQCLDAYSETEVLDGDNMWLCPRCKAKRRATKRLLISRLPDVLMVHLKRFSTVGHFREKLETNVLVPTQNLHMESYTVPGPHPSTRYTLYAVANHYGSLSSGHYTASVYSKPRDQWSHFDDTRVTTIDETQVATPAAYLLFFVQA